MRMIVRYVFFALCIGIAPGSYAQNPHTHQHAFGDAQKWSKVFDDPERDAWQKPHEVIQALALKPDAIVADIGAGTGYFAVRLAHNVPNGRVYAVDTEPDMVKHLAERAKANGVNNLTAVAAKPDDARIPEKTDVLLLVDVYHHIDKREAYFRKLAEALKPSGRVAIIDFAPDSPIGPPKSARVLPGRVTSELKAAGYDLVQEHTFLPNQYFLVFSPATR
ncbi:MAG TPA: class I SAM-dependent methyltransferase [Burkholderiales bacterium]|nr:class I SAM-dependent methyltransferase [Burkholderiales bacterium]